jgi:uncharacterized protein (UPF0548 family)
LDIFIRPYSQNSLQKRLDRARRDDVNYPEVGASLLDSTPSGYYELRQQLHMGTGQECFDRAREGLVTWQAHKGQSTSLYPMDAPLREGVTVLVLLGTTKIAVVAPCRVIRVIDQPGRFAFAYGTLPGHPEIGEESFEVRITDNEQVFVTIHAFSKAGLALVKAAGPLARNVQNRATKQYLVSLSRFVEKV